MVESEYSMDDKMERNTAHCVNDDDERITTSVATTTERAIWGVGSTVSAVATLWCAVVDTGALNSWSLACCVTVRGGGHGCDWDKDVGGRAGAGAIGMVCGVHDGMVGRCEMGVFGSLVGGMQRRGLIRELLWSRGHGRFVAAPTTYDRIGGKGKNK